jgi:hypothetical protein
VTLARRCLGVGLAGALVAGIVSVPAASASASTPQTASIVVRDGSGFQPGKPYVAIIDESGKVGWFASEAAAQAAAQAWQVRPASAGRVTLWSASGDTCLSTQGSVAGAAAVLTGRPKASCDQTTSASEMVVAGAAGARRIEFPGRTGSGQHLVYFGGLADQVMKFGVDTSSIRQAAHVVADGFSLGPGDSTPAPDPEPPVATGRTTLVGMDGSGSDRTKPWFAVVADSGAVETFATEAEARANAASFDVRRGHNGRHTLWSTSGSSCLAAMGSLYGTRQVLSSRPAAQCDLASAAATNEMSVARTSPSQTRIEFAGLGNQTRLTSFGATADRVIKLGVADSSLPVNSHVFASDFAFERTN